MKRLIEFPLTEGGSIVVEVDERENGGPVPAANPGEIAETAQQTFEQALDSIRPAAQAIIEKLRSVTDPPDEVEVKFALALNGKLGGIIATVGADVNYEVRLLWKRDQNKAPAS